MRFKRVYIEITNTCNLSCDFCIQNSRPPRQMHVEEFARVIEQVRPFTEYVYLHILGEPLSHPHLKELLAICDQAGLQVMLTTNAILLKQQLPLLCAASNLRQLNISLHSFPQHQHPSYQADVLTCGKALAKQGIHVNYRLWSLSNGSFDQDHQRLFSFLLREFHIEEKDVVPRRQMRVDLADHLHLHIEEVFTWPSLTNPLVGERGRCLGMQTMCGILVDGSVVPCCLDSKGDAALGNIFETPLADILASDRCQRMLHGFLKQQITEEICRHCSYRLRFTPDLQVAHT